MSACYEYYVYTVKDPKTIIDGSCNPVIDGNELIYRPNAPRLNIPWYTIHFNTFAEVWVMDKDQLVHACKENLLCFNTFDFENLGDGFYAIVCIDIG